MKFDFKQHFLYNLIMINFRSEEKMENSIEYIEGYHVHTLYKSAQYGPSIAIYKINNKKETLTGIMLPELNIKYRFAGTWVNHPKYGKQFKVTSYEEVIESNEKSIMEYLSSGLIKGIGKKTAEKIVNHFGLDTLDVMENDIDRLLEVKGITINKLDKIKLSFFESRASRSIALELTKHGISPKLAVAVYQSFGNSSLKIIDEKPYMLSTIRGITFPQADGLGKKTEEYETNYERFKACANYVLYQNEINGNKAIIGNRASGSTGMNKDDFGKAMLALLYIKKINGSFICENTIKMINEGLLVFKRIGNNQCLFLPGIYRLENNIADNLYRLCNNRPPLIKNLEKQISEAEKAIGITLGEKQKKAVIETFNNGLSLIVGPPGSGKTTTIKTIAYIYERNFNSNIQFLAPTGKAASRIKETSGYMASTIHSSIGITPDIINDVKENEIVFEDCLLGCDELSMLDVRCASQLFSAIGDNTIVVLCGDPDQLPSVGAGAILRDIVDSHVIPVTELDTIYRTDIDSNIYINANAIRKGQTTLSCGNDFRFCEVESAKTAEQMMINCYLEKVKQYGIENVMLISPFRDHDTGVNQLNKNIQSILNPSNVRDKIFWCGSSYYRIGDVVMHLKNNAQEKVVNGDIGVVKDIITIDNEMTMIVQYSDNTLAYTQENIDEVTLAYAYTVHKSQGSEAKCVITTIHGIHSLMLKRNIIYTAITRGKEEVCIFGQKQALEKAISTEDKSKRNTALPLLLNVKFGKFMPIYSIA